MQETLFTPLIATLLNVKSVLFIWERVTQAKAVCLPQPYQQMSRWHWSKQGHRGMKISTITSSLARSVKWSQYRKIQSELLFCICSFLNFYMNSNSISPLLNIRNIAKANFCFTSRPRIQNLLCYLLKADLNP